MNAPRIIAHRGHHANAPENSEAAISAAFSAGADAVEIDVHATVDRVVVVHHDPLAPTPEGLAPISSLRWDQVSRVRLSDGSAIPTLDNVLSLAAGRGHIHVEIKARGIEGPVMESISRAAADASVHSFDHRIVKRCGELSAGVRRGILLVSYLVDTVRAMRDAGATDVWQNHEFVDADLTRNVHDAGGKVIAWTVNALPDALDMMGSGADAICTDDVFGIRRALQR